jgi:hypothetical protein
MIADGHYRRATLPRNYRSPKPAVQTALARGLRPCLLDGPINGEQFPVPTLKRDDIVILDNFGSHKGKAVCAAVNACGARFLCLPKSRRTSIRSSSSFSKVKALVTRPPRSPTQSPTLGRTPSRIPNARKRTTKQRTLWRTVSAKSRHFAMANRAQTRCSVARSL